MTTQSSVKEKLDSFKQLNPLEYVDIVSTYFITKDSIDTYLRIPKVCVSFTNYNDIMYIMYITEDGAKLGNHPKRFKFQIPIIDGNYELQEIGNHYTPEVLYRENSFIRDTFDSLVKLGILEYTNLTFKFLCFDGNPKFTL